MDIRKINEQFRQFYEYMEEPDAFETESERKMQIELEKQIDKEYKEQEDKKQKEQTREFFKRRNGGIKRVEKFLRSLRNVRDIHLSEERVPTLSCYIPEREFHKFCEWNSKEDNVLKACGLKMETYNASEGYRIYIF